MKITPFYLVLAVALIVGAGSAYAFVSHSANIAKENGYAVVQSPSGQALIAKQNGYAVLQSPNGQAQIAKQNGYAVLQSLGGQALIAKEVGYIVVTPSLPTVQIIQ
jgi:transcription elongation GreA/GreB family factor